MSILVGGYVPAKKCTGAPTVGAKALMSWFLGAYGSRGGKNLGIYNCRDVRGGNTTSLHGEGRAGDLGINPHGAAWGWEVANFLVQNSKELGVQCVIYARKIWSSARADEGWRDYGGQADHFDHIHAELTPWGAANLTVGLLVAVAAPITSLPRPPAPAASSPSGRLLVKGLTGDDVLALQKRLIALGYGRWNPTRLFGDITHAAVLRFQRAKGLLADGKVGPATKKALGLL